MKNNVFYWLVLCLSSLLTTTQALADERLGPGVSIDPAPSDLALLANDSLIVTINQRAGTASMLQARDGQVLDEVAIGATPGAIQAIPGTQSVLITSREAGTIALWRVSGGRLEQVASLQTGFEPYGIAVSPDGQRAYVSVAAASQVAILE
ncbi:MAG: hypothetical protein KDA42_11980, partial [Planctomycetales bacterium]|nr:hypothetical protein [Planctomycetales bacterium]